MMARHISAERGLAGEVEQGALVVGSAELLVLLHEGWQVHVLRQELLMELLRLLVQLGHFT